MSMPLIIGHRGASQDAPENTLAAFRLAWEQGADGIEGDFHLSRDGQVVCIHDATTQRTGGRPVPVAEQTLAELRTLDVGAWKGERWRGERIPTLAEVLAIVPPGKRLFVEVKGDERMIAPLVRELAPTPPGQVTIISFGPSLIAGLRRELPAMEGCLLTSFRRHPVSGRRLPTLPTLRRMLRDCNASGLDFMAWPTMDRRFVSALRADGYRLHSWVHNEPALARRYVELGIDSLTTDCPGKLRKALEGGKQVAL